MENQSNRDWSEWNVREKRTMKNRLRQQKSFYIRAAALSAHYVRIVHSVRCAHFSVWIWIDWKRGGESSAERARAPDWNQIPNDFCSEAERAATETRCFDIFGFSMVSAQSLCEQNNLLYTIILWCGCCWCLHIANHSRVYHRMKTCGETKARENPTKESWSGRSTIGRQKAFAAAEQAREVSAQVHRSISSQQTI